MNKCYIVEGSTGEYSHRNNWIVRVFLSEKRAKEFCMTLNDWCRGNGVGRLNREQRNLLEFDSRWETKCPLDTKFSCDYTGTDYTMCEAELEETL